MALSSFPGSHPALTLENYAYMRQLWQRQQALHDNRQERAWPRERSLSVSSAGRPLSGSALVSPRFEQGGSGSRVPWRRHMSRLVRILIPFKLGKTKSGADQSASDDDSQTRGAPCISPPFGSPRPPTAPRPHTGGTHDPRIEIFSADSAKNVFRLYSTKLTNPFSPDFEFNPLHLNINHPLLSQQNTRQENTRQRHLRILDLGNCEGSVYTQAIANLPDVSFVYQLTQPQLSTNFSPYLPLKSNSFDVVTSRTLYKFISNPYRPQTLEPIIWVREIYRILDGGGIFEFLFFESLLKDTGPLTKQIERYLYDDHRFCSCREIYGACTCTSAPSQEHITGTQFLKLLASEGFTTEKFTTLMFPFPLLSALFTQDGQRLRLNQAQIGQSKDSLLLVSLTEAIEEECRESQTAWKCIIGFARKEC